MMVKNLRDDKKHIVTQLLAEQFFYFAQIIRNQIIFNGLIFFMKLF